MNAPDFSHEPRGYRGGLPVEVTGMPRDVARERILTQATPAADYGFDEPEVNYTELFFKYLSLAIKHRWIILSCCLAGLLCGFLVTFASTPLYRATASLQIDRDAAKVVKLDTPDINADSGDTFRFYQTQYDLLKSRTLAERTAAKLDLGDDAAFSNKSSSPWRKLWSMIFPSNAGGNTLDLAQRKAIVSGMIQGGLAVNPVANSRLVRISIDATDPRWAAAVVNAVADEYVNSNLERRYGATAYARKFLEEKLAELKIKLEESERALVAYQQKEQIVTAKDRQPLAESDLAALHTALQGVRSERIAAEQLWKEAARGEVTLSLPQVLEDKSIQLLRDKRASLVADYQEKLGMFKPDYPDMRRLNAQIGQLELEIKEGVNIIKGSLKTRYDALLRHEDLLKKHIEQAGSQVLESRDKNIELQILQRESDTNRTLYDGLLQQYKDIGVAGAVTANNIAIIDRAQTPGGPFYPVLQKNLLIWLMIGLVLAALAIIVLEILDDTFKSPEDVETQLGLSVLGLIPKVEQNIIQGLRETPGSPIAEAYRSFRTALQFSTARGLPKSLVVTSALPGEGKSTTSVALGINLAQLGMKILVIDADLRNPSAHYLLGLPSDVGLTNYLAGMTAAQNMLQRTDVPGLYFIATGPLSPNPAELLAGQKMAKLLSTASENFDIVIVDAPPVLGLADAPILGSIAAATLLVLSEGHTRRGVVKAALKRMHFARACMIGAVLNKFDLKTASYTYASYGHLQHYGYGAKVLPKAGAVQS